MEIGSTGPAGERGDSVRALLAALTAAIGSKPETPIASLVDLYLGDLRSRSTPGHAAKCAKQIRRVLATCPGPTTAEVFEHRSMRLRGSDAERPVSRRTVEMEIGALRALIKWGIRGGLIEHDPLARLSPLAIRQGDRVRRPREFTKHELRLFLAAARQQDKAFGRCRQAPNWRFLACSGLRWGEAALLKREHLRGDLVHVPATIAKARRERVVILPADLAAYFKSIDGELMRAPLGGTWRTASHSTIHRMFRRTMKAAGLDRRDANGRLLTIHSFRRNAITGWSREGVSDQFVSKMAGHSSTAFTEKWYLDTTSADAVDELRKIRRRRGRAEKKDDRSKKAPAPAGRENRQRSRTEA